MIKYLLFLAFLVHTAAFGQFQGQCPPTYIPKPFQDCVGAIPVCALEYASPDGGVCGDGLIANEVQSSCGTAEVYSSWYTFQAQTDGLLAFYILPNDIRHPDDFSARDGERDYDWVLFRFPGTMAGRHPSDLCGMLRRNTTYQVSCNFAGQRGVTGMYDRQGALPAGSSQNAGGTRFNDPLPVQAGDRFYLMINNCSVDSVGYVLRFLGLADSTRYADISFATQQGIEAVAYDPNCIGNCPVLLRTSRPVNCSSLGVRVINPMNVTQPISASALCFRNQAYSDSLWIVGDFNPLDSSLSIVLTDFDSSGFRYLCAGGLVVSDTIQLKPRRPGQYSTITDTKKLEGYTRNLLAPNPFTNQIVATLPVTGSYQITLYNELGVRVYRQEGLSGQTVLVLPAGLARGLYSAEITGQGKRWRQRLLRQE